MISHKTKREIPLHIMLLLPVILVLIYNYGPMFGLFVAFQHYVPSARGLLHSFFNGRWIGFDMFRYMFMLPDFPLVLRNTVFISVMKIAAKIVFPLIFALMLNEVGRRSVKKSVQTITFLPYFLSWVILGGILLEVFSPRDGVVNLILERLGGEPVYFFGNAGLFPFMIVVTDLWKEIGFNTIILLAALTGIDPTLYEAAAIDGAGRLRQTTSITIPSILGIVVLLTILGMGNVLNAGMDQVLMLYGPSVYETGDIIDTFVYRMGLQNGQFALATAMGLFKSVVSLVLLVFSYAVAHRYTNYRIF